MARIVEHERLRANPDFREHQQIDYGESRQSQTTRAGLRRDWECTKMLLARCGPAFCRSSRRVR
jgi:hypothetical protein